MTTAFSLRTKVGYLIEQVVEFPATPPRRPTGKQTLTRTLYLLTVDGSLSDTAVSSINDPYRGQMGGGMGGMGSGQFARSTPVGPMTTPGGGPAPPGGIVQPGGGGMGKKSNSTTQLSAAGKGLSQVANPLDDLKPVDDMRDMPPSVPLQMLAGSDNQGT